ncbi:MAG: hypothetical protein ACR650_16560 [Methylocystis sp.]
MPIITLTSISEFGAKPYTEDEAKAQSEIVKSFNETIKQYQRDSSLQNIIMTSAEDRDRIFNHLFSRALCEASERQG